MCTKGQLTPKGLSVLNDPNRDVNMVCLTPQLRGAIRRCGSAYIQNILHAEDVSIFETEALDCMFSAINRSPCDTASRRVMYLVARLNMETFIGIEIANADESTTVDFRSFARCTVGVYGDPHLKMCTSESQITCSAPGEQTYISNEFMTIKGTNVGVGVITEPRATSLKSISITFNSIESGEVIATYNTNDGKLPTAFDSSISSEAGSGNDTVEINLDSSGRIRFVQKGTGALFVLRQWDGNYFFTLRMTETVILSSQGLLVDGCPEDQIVNRNQFLNRRKRQSEWECSTECDRVADVTLRDPCILDCLATQNPDFATNMTKGAMEDSELVVTYDETLREGAVRIATNLVIGVPQDSSSVADTTSSVDPSGPTGITMPNTGPALESGHEFCLITALACIYFFTFE